MDPNQFVTIRNLKDETKAILEETEKISGKPIVFIHKPDLPVQALVKIARSSMDHHIIIYSGTDSSILNHNIVHECGHIRRYYSVKKEERLMPFSDQGAKIDAITDIEKRAGSFIKKIPINLRYQLIPIWINGLVQQVTNLPSDIYIEQWIFNNYPSLHDDQERSLKQTHLKATNCLRSEIQSQIPDHIINSSIAMNYAFFKKIDKISGSSFFKAFEQSSVRKTGEKLYLCLDNDDNGLIGDISIIDTWSRILQIKDWFKWTDFENIPIGYENVY